MSVSPCVRVLCLALASISAVASAQSAKVSRPFHYSGYSSPDWASYSRSATFVTMKDGTKLAVDVVLPAEYHGAGQAPTRFPVVFRYTPYGRSFLMLATGKVASFVELPIVGTGPRDSRAG